MPQDLLGPLVRTTGLVIVSDLRSEDGGARWRR
jgi:hypothetical protein